MIEQVIVEGQEQGLFRKDLLPSVLARGLFGAVDELALAWLLSKKREFQSTQTSERTRSVHGCELLDKEMLSNFLHNGLNLQCLILH